MCEREEARQREREERTASKGDRNSRKKLQHSEQANQTTISITQTFAVNIIIDIICGHVNENQLLVSDKRKDKINLKWY